MKHTLFRRLNISLVATSVALCLAVLAVAGASANTVNIYDQSHVLNADQLRSEASNLPNPLSIYTTNTFTGDAAAFEQRAYTHVTNPNQLVMAIDTNSVDKHVAIVGGSSVPLSQNQYNSATQAFVQAYQSNSGNYTAATIASLHTLRSALGAAPANPANPNSGNGGTVPVPTSNGGLFSNLLGTTCCIGVILLVGLVLLFTVGRRMFGPGRREQGIPPYYNQPYPPKYGPYYNQGPGMNPWAAGGLGAAAGGLLGYELGKESGENEARADGGQNGTNDAGGNDFGGGSVADFGNGGAGSSADFGGGAGGDFGGSSSSSSDF